MNNSKLLQLFYFKEGRINNSNEFIKKKVNFIFDY